MKNTGRHLFRFGLAFALELGMVSLISAAVYKNGVMTILDPVDTWLTWTANQGGTVGGAISGNLGLQAALLTSL